MGKPIMMGRKTYESIGRPLPGRRNIIISRNPNYQKTGCEVYNSIVTAIQACRNVQELMIIGGSGLYKVLLPSADKIYLTFINSEFSGDTFFPDFDQSQWREIKRIDITDDNQVDFDYSFITLSRVTIN